MKKVLLTPAQALFTLAILVLAGQKIHSQQNPGGVTGSVAWYKADAGITLVSGLVSTWNDNSTSANHATQGTATNRPGLSMNSINFNPALTFLTASTPQFLNTGATGLPAGGAARSIFFVASFNNTATTGAWLYGYGGASGAACRKYNAGKFLGNDQLLVSGTTCLLDPANTFWATADFPKQGTIVFDGTNGTFYDAGTNLGTDADPGLNTQATSGIIGAFHANTAEYWRGTIAEIAVYPVAVTGTDAARIETYLALKYGIHKTGNYLSSAGGTIWDSTANSAFHNDVFGITVDNGSGLSQLQSNSVNTGGGDGTGQTGEANIVLSTAALNDLEYMIIGRSTADLQFNNSNVPGSLSGYARVNRSWLINRSVTFQSTSVTMQLNYSGLGFVDPSSAGAFKLLVDTDGDGDFSNATIIDPASVNTGTSVVSFDVPLTTAINNAQFSFAGSAVALPVKLKSFGYNTRGCNATLKWTSLVEENLKSYHVEVNINGGGWTALKEIPAAANGLRAENNYSTDVTLQSGKNNFYRLKMMDINGAYDFSPILRIRCEGARPEITLVPNPASSRISIGGIEPGDVIRIYSMKGSIINSIVTAGNVEEINIFALPHSSYSAEVIRKGRKIFSKVFIKN